MTTPTVNFDALEVMYDPRVIEPRPWTAMQSHWAAEIAPLVPEGPILELCCGAGHIGLLAAVRSGRRLVQVDADPTACHWATRNAIAAGMASKVEVRCGTMVLQLGHEERYPLIIADPPYLPSAETARYPADPRLAIDGGADGLDVVRECIAVIDRTLTPDGAALLQLRGVAQVGQATGLLPRSLTVAGIRHDGPERAVVRLDRVRSRR